MGLPHLAGAHFRYTYFITVVESCAFASQAGLIINEKLLYFAGGADHQ